MKEEVKKGNSYIYLKIGPLFFSF